MTDPPQTPQARRRSGNETPDPEKGSRKGVRTIYDSCRKSFWIEWVVAPCKFTREAISGAPRERKRGRTEKERKRNEKGNEKGVRTIYDDCRKVFCRRIQNKHVFRS